MNKEQRYVLYACAAVILLMLLFPPFHLPGPPHYGLGYGFLLDPGYSIRENYGTVDIGTLLVQWLGVILVGAILCLTFRDRKEEAQKFPLRDSEAEELHPEIEKGQVEKTLKTCPACNQPSRQLDAKMCTYCGYPF